MHRRFLNLVMHDNARSICSLYRMDLKHLFYETAQIAEQAAEANAKKNKLRDLSMIESWNGLRKPLFSFRPSNFFTLLRESSIMMADSSGRTTLLDTDFNSILTMLPMRHGKGSNTVCFSMPHPNPFNSLNSQCLFVLDLVPGSSTKSTFEVLNYMASDISQPLLSSHLDMNWSWSALPVPSFIDDPVYSTSTKMCSSMLFGRSTICVSSMEEGVGTYTFDTVSHKWSKAGNWVLPFCGNAEYVPKFKLWFALSASSAGSPHSLCALDLPATGIEEPPECALELPATGFELPPECALDLPPTGLKLPPELKCTWDYLDLPEQIPYKRLLLNLGSGKFSIVSFFKTLKWIGGEMMEDESAVFTGVEVRHCNSGEGHVRMISHMSKRYSFGAYRIHCVL